jgi:hypothetical protein
MESAERGVDLPGRVVDEIDAGLNVGLETLDGLVEEFLLVCVGLAENVDGLLSTTSLDNVSLN